MGKGKSGRVSHVKGPYFGNFKNKFKYKEKGDKNEFYDNDIILGSNDLSKDVNKNKKG